MRFRAEEEIAEVDKIFNKCNMKAAEISASAVDKTSKLQDLHNNIRKKLIEEHEIDVILGEQQIRDAVHNAVRLPQYQLYMPNLLETGEFLYVTATML